MMFYDILKSMEQIILPSRETIDRQFKLNADFFMSLYASYVLDIFGEVAGETITQKDFETKLDEVVTTLTETFAGLTPHAQTLRSKIKKALISQ